MDRSNFCGFYRLNDSELTAVAHEERAITQRQVGYVMA